MPFEREIPASNVQLRAHAHTTDGPTANHDHLVGHLPMNDFNKMNKMNEANKMSGTPGSFDESPLTSAEKKQLSEAERRIHALEERQKPGMSWQQQLKIQREIWGTKLPHGMHVKEFLPPVHLHD